MAATTSSVKVLSWNIERGLRLSDVTGILRRSGASLVLLQEVDLNSLRTRRRNIAAELARSLQMRYLFAAEFDELGQGRRDSPAYHGQAILTSLATSSPRIIRFEHQTGFWRPRSYLPNWGVFQRRTGGRLALVAEVDVAGRPLVVYNAHLESRGSEQLRKAQIEEILADTRRYPVDMPILIAGDFNTRRTSNPVIAALLEAGFHMAVGQHVTTTRGSALDWIFVRGPLTFEQGAIHSDAKASDHFPLTVVIHLDSSSPAGASSSLTTIPRRSASRIISGAGIASPGLTAPAWLNVLLAVAWLAPYQTSLLNIERGLYDSNGASNSQLVERLR